MRTQNDHPNVVALPPLIYLTSFAAGLLVEFLWRTHLFTPPVRLTIGSALFVAGTLVGFQAYRQFQRAKTNVEVYKPATALVTTGPYRYSRNPMYVGLTLAYAGLALIADSLWVLGLLAPVLVLMHYGVILREEEYLVGKFGATYVRYQAAVHRWL